MIKIVDTSLEIECKACGEKYWYSGEKEYPETIQCPECSVENLIPEDG